MSDLGPQRQFGRTLLGSASASKTSVDQKSPLLQLNTEQFQHYGTGESSVTFNKPCSNLTQINVIW